MSAAGSATAQSSRPHPKRGRVRKSGSRKQRQSIAAKASSSQPRRQLGQSSQYVASQAVHKATPSAASSING